MIKVDQDRVSIRLDDRTLLIAVAIITALLIYATELASFTLSIDEELNGASPDTWKTWIAQGRWAMGLLVYICPRTISVVPFVPTLVFVVGVVGSAVMLAELFADRRSTAIAFVVTFVASPIWLHIAEFNTLSWGFGVGLVATVFALRRLELNAKRIVQAGLLVAFAIGIYQVLLLFFVAAGMLLAIRETVAKSEQRSRTGGFSFSSLVAVAGASGLAVLIHGAMAPLALAVAKAEPEYVQRYLLLSAYGTAPAYYVGRAGARIAGFVLGTDPTFLGVGWISLLLAAAGVLAGLVVLRRDDSSVRAKFYIGALAVGSLIVACSPIIASAATIPTRALIIFPLLYAALAAVAFHHFQPRRALWLALIAGLLANSYVASSLFYADRLARERDAVMGTRLIEHIEEVGRSRFGSNIPLAIVGDWRPDHKLPARQVEVFGTSFFEHDGGNPYRIAVYLSLISGRGFSAVPIEAIRDRLKMLESKPSWPAPGSVIATETEVIVKLREPTSEQRRTLKEPIPSAAARETARPGRIVDKSVLRQLNASSWGSHYKSIQLFAADGTRPSKPNEISRAVAQLPSKLNSKGGTLHALITVPQWLVLDEHGAAFRQADGVVFRVKDAATNRELAERLLNPHANADERRWNQVDVAIPAGVTAIIVEAAPGIAPSSNNAYDQLFISIREPLVFRRAPIPAN